MTKKEKPQIIEDVMRKIELGELKMTSKKVVIAKMLGLQTAFGLAVVIAILATNFALYWFTTSEAFWELTRGKPELKLLLWEFPYIYVLTGTICLLLVNLLWKKFDISYKHPYKYIMPVLVVLVIIAGMIIWKSGINERMEMRYQHKPIMKHLYRQRMIKGESIEREHPRLQMENRRLYQAPYNLK